MHVSLLLSLQKWDVMRMRMMGHRREENVPLSSKLEILDIDSMRDSWDVESPRWLALVAVVGGLSLD